MATYTTNIGLAKPAPTDPADIAVLNSNFDKIDTKCNPALFAPSGYGLGTTGTYCANANNANKSGWYGVDTNTTNIPSGAPGTMFAKTLSTENGTDIYQTVTSGVTAIRRYYSSWAGAWQPWEYENPPMSLGVEYRTTERHNGAVVYKKLVDCGALPNASRKWVSVADGCTVFRCNGIAFGGTDSITLPFMYDSTHMAIVYGQQSNIVISTSYDMSALYTLTYVTAWYTK